MGSISSYSYSLDQYAINSQEIEKKRQRLLNKKYLFAQSFNPNLLDKSKDVFASIDYKGKLLFWQFHNQKENYAMPEKFQNIGNFKFNLRDRSGIVTAVGFENILIVGFKTRQVAVYYLGVDTPTFEFVATDYPIKEIQIKQVRTRHL